MQTGEQDKWGKGTHCRQWNRTSGEKVLTADHGTGQVGQRYSLQTVLTQLDQHLQLAILKRHPVQKLWQLH